MAAYRQNVLLSEALTPILGTVIHDEGVELLHWMHGALHLWLDPMNRVPAIWQGWEIMRPRLNPKSSGNTALGTSPANPVAEKAGR